MNLCLERTHLNNSPSVALAGIQVPHSLLGASSGHYMVRLAKRYLAGVEEYGSSQSIGRARQKIESKPLVVCVGVCLSTHTETANLQTAS